MREDQSLCLTRKTLDTASHVMVLVVAAGLGVHAQEAFQVLSNASLTHYELAYLTMFAIPIAGAVTVQRALPVWLRWLSIIGFCSTLFSLLISAYPFVDVVNPRLYAAKILGTVIGSNALALTFYKFRSRSVVRQQR